MYLAPDIREFTACRCFRLCWGCSVVPHRGGGGAPYWVSVLELLLSVVKRWKTTDLYQIKICFVNVVFVWCGFIRWHWDRTHSLNCNISSFSDICSSYWRRWRRFWTKCSRAIYVTVRTAGICCAGRVSATFSKSKPMFGTNLQRQIVTLPQSALTNQQHCLFRRSETFLQ